MITTDAHYKLDEVLPRLKAYTTGKVVEKVTCKEKYTLKGSRNCQRTARFPEVQNLCRQRMRRENGEETVACQNFKWYRQTGGAS